MTTTPPPASEQDTFSEEPPRTGPRVSAAEARDLSRLRRSTTDRKIAGVSGGLGRHLDVDPTLIRVTFVVLVLFGGAGLLLYAVCWLLVPDDRSGHAKLDLEPGARTIALAGAGVLAALVLVGHAWGGVGFPWPVAVAGLVVLAVVASRRDRAPVPGPYGPGAPYDAVPPGAPVGPGAPVSLEKDPARTEGSTEWTTPPPTWIAPPPAPRPRPYRGPRLFLPTLALIAVGWGVLRLVDLGGRDVPGAAYPALALAVCGVVLVVGAWFGRVLGVVLLALLSGLALAIASVAAGPGGRTVETPTTASAVRSTYDLGVGELTVDLSKVTDVAALDGRTVAIDANVGQVTVIVPAGVDVDATARIGAYGAVDVFGVTADGDSPHISRRLDGGPTAPELTIVADLDLGELTVRTS